MDFALTGVVNLGFYCSEISTNLQGAVAKISLKVCAAYKCRWTWILLAEYDATEAINLLHTPNFI